MSDTLFETMKLFTSDGHLVAEVRIPVFKPRADALLWGERFFIYRANEYREGFVYAIPAPTDEYGR